MDGVAISIIGRPRPLPGHDTPNAAHNTYTLKCEEPDYSHNEPPMESFPWTDRHRSHQRGASDR